MQPLTADDLELEALLWRMELVSMAEYERWLDDREYAMEVAEAERLAANARMRPLSEE